MINVDEEKFHACSRVHLKDSIPFSVSRYSRCSLWNCNTHANDIIKSQIRPDSYDRAAHRRGSDYHRSKYEYTLSFLFSPWVPTWERGLRILRRHETGGENLYSNDRALPTFGSFWKIWLKRIALASIYRLFTFQRPSPSDISTIFYSLVNSRRLLMIEIQLHLTRYLCGEEVVYNSTRTSRKCVFLSRATRTIRKIRKTWRNFVREVSTRSKVDNR